MERDIFSYVCSLNEFTALFFSGQSSAKGKKCLFAARRGHPFPYFVSLFTWTLNEASGQRSGDCELSTLLVFRVSPIMTHWSLLGDWQSGVCSRNDIMFTGIVKGLGHLSRTDVW